MKSFSHFLFLCCFLCCTCTIQKDSSTVLLSVSLDRNDAVSSTSLIGDVDFVLLETKEECLLRTIDKIEFFLGNFYILDKKQGSVFVFDQLGKFVCRIGACGNTPNEYVGIADFTIDKDNEHVIILSNHQPKLYIYDMQGEFLESKKNGEIQFWNIVSDKSGFVCTTNRCIDVIDQDVFLLYRFDKAFNLLSQHELLPSKPFYGLSLLSSPFRLLDNHIWYVDNFNCRIYSIAGQVEPFYNIDYKNPMPVDFFHGMTFWDNQLKYDWLMDWFLLKDRIILASILNGKYYVTIMDLNGNVLKNGMYGPFTLPKMFQGDEDEVLSPIDPKSYLEVWKDFSPQGKEVSLESNNLIMRWRFKDL